MKKVAVLTVVLLVLCTGYISPVLSGQIATLKPGASSSDVKVLKKPIPVEKSSVKKPKAIVNEPTGIIDTLRAYTGIGGINFGFTDGDSMLVWLQPEAACSLVAIRLNVINWEGNMLLDIWDGSRYDGHITTQDSTDANGWIGTYVPITSTNWVPGPVMGHTPLGWNAMDPEHHFWGPFPYTITPSHAESWVEIPASAGIQGEVELGSNPFYVGAVFFRTAGWGFLTDDPKYLPYSFFKFYQQCCGPDDTHDGWFIRSYSPWVEVIVSYYRNTPPSISGMTVHNDTYGPGPFHIEAEITDVDAENPANAGVASAYLVYTINAITDSVIMDGPFQGGTFTGNIPPIEPWDSIIYSIRACDPADLCSESITTSFRRLKPVHELADILLINDGMQIDSLYLDMFDHRIVDPQENLYEYEYWDMSAHHGIDASVINRGWKTIIIAGWGCRNTLPGFEYSSQDIYASFLEAGVSEESPHNILYIDQDYFCVQDDYGCDWDEELLEEDFLYDYFGVAFAISDNHGAEVGDYDSDAVGITGDPITNEFVEHPINFRPDVLTSNPENWNWPDWIESQVSGAVRLFTYRDTQFGAGVRYDGGYFKTVYLPWQLDFAVDTTESGDVVPRSGVPLLMQNILWWFDTESRRLGTDPVEEQTPTPERYILDQNYPNPFNVTTDIGYEMPDSRSSSPVSLRIFNILGQEVRTVVNEEQDPGQYVVTWDGKDHNGTDVSSGVYFYQLFIDKNMTQTRRMMLLR
jgi:hypothetical protein